MNKKGSFMCIIWIFVIAIVIGASAYGMIYAFTTGNETITIKEKWVKFQGEDAKYLVSSEDGQVFQITDSIVKLRFDSSNTYASIDEGETYKINTQGWRFAFLSDYKNTLEVELVE